MEPLGVLLITGGRTHQENYAPAFAADRRCRLVGLTDEANVDANRTAWNAELARTLGIPLLPNLDAALSRRDVHLVSVCSEPERRARLAAKAARAGKHVYVDKPLGGVLAQVDDLVEAVRVAKVKSQMFSLLRTSAARRTHSLLQTGKLGNLLAIHADLLFAKGYTGTAPLVRQRREQYPPQRFDLMDSKRELYTTGIYSLVLIGWLTGRRFTSVRALTANYFFQEHVRDDVEDFGALLLTLESGLIATLTAGRIGWLSHPAGGPNTVTLVGSNGNATIDAYRPRIEFSTDESAWQPPRRHPGDPMGFWSSTQQAAGLTPKKNWQVLEENSGISDQSFFVDCIVHDRESDLPIRAAAHANEVLFAAYRSAAENQTVALPLPRP